jgi:sodium-dependent dicarboxylate transporter 2/3/5
MPKSGSTDGVEVLDQEVPRGPQPPDPELHEEDVGDRATFIKRLGLIGGVVLFAMMQVVPGPAGLPPEGWTAASVTVLMACWWLTEAVPIPVTALLPLVLFPALGLMSMTEAAAPYAHELIFLFMGAFFLAAAMEKCGVHRRISLAIVSAIGVSPKRIILGFMVATAFISMWISNTATASMMLPMALAVGAMFKPAPGEPGSHGQYNFGIALMLGIAYSASIGGVGTLIGTAPNTMFAAAATELTGQPIGFVQYMMVGVPIIFLMLPLTWLILLRIYPPGELRGDAKQVIVDERSRLGPASRAEKWVGFVFSLTVLAWVMRAPKELGEVTVPGIATWLPGVTDGTVAMASALILFVIPFNWKKGEVALDWGTAVKIPWGVLLLFGGGLALADGMSSTGLADWIGGGVESLAGWPTVVMIAISATLFIFLTEITSNTAVTAMAMPIMAGAAVTLGLPPAVLMGTVAIGCSMAFCLPVGTPPNAIVFSSGYLTIGQMAYAGIWINLLAITMVTFAGMVLLPAVFG